MTERYRIKYKLFRGWEPQQRYTMGVSEGEKWFPLNPDGYWLEPGAYSFGKITKHNYFTKSEAQRITTFAMSINQENIREVQPSKDSE